MGTVKFKRDISTQSAESGIYTIHRPTQCNIKLPECNKPIHKQSNNVYTGKEIVKVSQNGRWREIIVPSKNRILYPAFWSRSEYERIKQKSKLLTNEEKLRLAELKENEYKKNLEDIKTRKELLEKSKKIQPQDPDEDIYDIPKQETSINTLKRSSELKSEALQGPRIANQIILASKCHAIRDVQLQEKILIKNEIQAEEKRLDIMMEESRKAAIREEEKKQNILKKQRIENIQLIKEQIIEKEKRKLLEQEKSKVEGKIIVHNAIILNEEYEAEQRRKKIENTERLKRLLDLGNEELKRNKELQREKETILNKRIEMFIKQRKERDEKFKEDKRLAKEAEEKEKLLMIQTQESEKKFHEEMENLRYMKIQEDVEREFRIRARNAALKKVKTLKDLQKAREEQISNIRSQIAVELAKDEKVYENVKQKFAEDLEKDEKIKKLRKQSTEAYKQKLLEQIKQKETLRLREKEQLRKESSELAADLERKDEIEKSIIKKKVDELREQKVAEPYIAEIEQRLKKLKYY